MVKRLDGLSVLPFVLLGVLMLPGCPGGGPGPQPSPPPPWQCELDMPGCHETDPPQQCSSEESPCWHNPTGSPEHCEEAPKCEEPPVELPEPQCTQFMDRGGTVRPLGESCDCYFGHAWNPCESEECVFPQGVPEGEFVEGGTTHVLGTQVNAAMERVTRCQTGTNCDAGPSADEFFDQVNAELRAQGLCAGRHNDSPPGASDEIAVATACTGTWESYHVYNYGGGKVVWSPGAARPSYRIPEKYCGPAPPTPTPPPAGGCPAPHPDLSRMKFKSKEDGSHLDTTWTTVNQEPFCAEIGMSPMEDGTLRAGCPVRPEGHVDRATCEAVLCDQKWECNGEPYPPYRGNPAQTDCRGHYKTRCSAPGSTAVLEGDR